MPSPPRPDCAPLQVSLYQQQYTRQLSLTEAQLTSTIQTNLDHVKKAMDTIKQSEDTMAKLVGEFEGMQDQLGKSRSQLGKYEHIRSINIANR